MKKFKLTGFTFLASFLLLSGCAGFGDAKNYADKGNFDGQNTYEVRDVSGTLEYEGTGKDVEVYFKATTQYDSSGELVDIPAADQKRIRLDDEKVAQIGYTSKTRYEELKFDGRDSTANAQLRSFEEKDGKLYYLTIVAASSIEVDGEIVALPYPVYNFEEKEVLLDEAHALEVYNFNEKLYKELGDKANYKVKEGDYASIYFKTADDGSIGEEIQAFEIEIREDTDASIVIAQVYLDEDNNERTIDGNPLFDIVVQVDGLQYSLRYNRPFEVGQANIDEMINEGQVNRLITYRYYDIVDAEGNVLIAIPDLVNFSTPEEGVLIYEDESGAYQLNYDDVRVEWIVEHPNKDPNSTSLSAANPIIIEANVFQGNDRHLGVGEFAAIHLVATPIQAELPAETV